MSNHHPCAPENNTRLLSNIHDQFGQLAALLECIEQAATDDTGHPNPRAAQLACIGQAITLMWLDNTEQYKIMEESSHE